MENDNTYGMLCQLYCFEIADSNCSTAGDAITKLKRGPVNIPEVVYNLSCDGDKWLDTEFELP